MLYLFLLLFVKESNFAFVMCIPSHLLNHLTAFHEILHTRVTLKTTPISNL
jgi:hypothetical protein